MGVSPLSLSPERAPGAGPLSMAPVDTLGQSHPSLPVLGVQKKALLLWLMCWAHCPGRNKDCGFKLSDQAALPSRKDCPPGSWAGRGQEGDLRERGQGTFESN